MLEQIHAGDEIEATVVKTEDGQGKSHELEVSEQFFMEFRQMERRNRNLF